MSDNRMTPLTRSEMAAAAIGFRTSTKLALNLGVATAQVLDFLHGHPMKASALRP